MVRIHPPHPFTVSYRGMRCALIVLILLWSAPVYAEKTVLLPKQKPEIKENIHRVHGGFEYRRGAISLRGPRLPKLKPPRGHRQYNGSKTYGLMFEVRF